MNDSAVAYRTVTIAEKGESIVALSASQAARLQEMRFCRVLPTSDEGIWRVTDVSRVGVVGLDGLRLVIQPKTPLRSLIFMASYGGGQVVVDDHAFSFEVDSDLPAALAASLLHAIDSATRRGLLKGYVAAEETSTVVRGRWDVARQLKVRPGIPSPVELTLDDYTEDVAENRILRAALSALTRQERLPERLLKELSAALFMFAGVSDLRVIGPLAIPPLTRLNAHYQPALRLARWIIEASSWARQAGATAGSTFLVNMAHVYENFVGTVLQEFLDSDGLDVELQASDWNLDVDGRVRMRPDIVISRHAQVITVADTKYKVWGAGSGSPPNADVYQALAYAVTAGVPEAHLLYVSGDVEPQRYLIVATGTTVVAHAISLDGTPEELIERVHELGAALSDTHEKQVMD